MCVWVGGCARACVCVCACVCGCVCVCAARRRNVVIEAWLPSFSYRVSFVLFSFLFFSFVSFLAIVSAGNFFFFAQRGSWPSFFYRVFFYRVFSFLRNAFDWRKYEMSIIPSSLFTSRKQQIVMKMCQNSRIFVKKLDDYRVFFTDFLWAILKSPNFENRSHFKMEMHLLERRNENWSLYIVDIDPVSTFYVIWFNSDYINTFHHCITEFSFMCSGK